MGDSGLRREEAASARHENQKAVGLRNTREAGVGTDDRRQRPTRARGAGERRNARGVARALADRDKDFEGAKVGGAGALAGPLLGPVIIPWTEASRRHIGGKAATAAGTKRILAFQPRWVDRVTPPTV